MTMPRPTVAEQAREVLASGAEISPQDRQFLEFVSGAEFAEKTNGELHQNPDGTYAPMNESRLIEAESLDGPVEIKAGYAFKDGVGSVKVRNLEVDNSNVRAADMAHLKKSNPVFFRENVVRGWYPLDHPYWKESD